MAYKQETTEIARRTYAPPQASCDDCPQITGVISGIETRLSGDHMVWSEIVRRALEYDRMKRVVALLAFSLLAAQ
jgi:hypothetical protein